MGTPYDGIILVDKNEGESSFGVVKRVKRILKAKKVGHAGTLDPFATGLLIVLLGQGTKLSPYLMAEKKVYRGTMRLGIETDTQDPTGRVIETRPVPQLELQYIRKKAVDFVGEIEQVPPIFSALNVEGKRAYELARKGIKIELEKRKVNVHSLEIISVELPDVTMEVCCSSGTYMRSLAVALGRELGPGAHLKSLRRLSSGPFTLKEALNFDQMGFISASPIFRESIIPLREALPHMKETQVNDQMAKKIRNGHQPNWEELFKQSNLGDFHDDYMKLAKGTELVAIMKVGRLSGDDRRRLEIMRVFS
ncbi:MAG: tRNA pseudouridine(55) synthase TruB [Desulfatiglandales bacterium]